MLSRIKDKLNYHIKQIIRDIPLEFGKKINYNLEYNANENCRNNVFCTSQDSYARIKEYSEKFLR